MLLIPRFFAILVSYLLLLTTATSIHAYFQAQLVFCASLVFSYLDFTAKRNRKRYAWVSIVVHIPWILASVGFFFSLLYLLDVVTDSPTDPIAVNLIYGLTGDPWITIPVVWFQVLGAVLVAVSLIEAAIREE